MVQSGITDLRPMRPTAPDASTSYAPEATLFTPQLLDAMSHFTVIRHQYVANLLRYGSDGVEPYTSPAPNPVYPPLNPNLRVYLELENELWNWASVFYTDFGNINALTTADADAIWTFTGVPCEKS